jgi:hypothetical protein
MSTAQAIPLDPRPVPKEQKQRPAAREKQKRTTGRATVEDAEERTPVLAVLGTPSVSVARVAGTIRVSIVGGVPCLLIGKEDSETDQIKFGFPIANLHTAIFVMKNLLPSSLRDF